MQEMGDEPTGKTAKITAKTVTVLFFGLVRSKQHSPLSNPVHYYEKRKHILKNPLLDGDTKEIDVMTTQKTELPCLSGYLTTCT